MYLRWKLGGPRARRAAELVAWCRRGSFGYAVNARSAQICAQASILPPLARLCGKLRRTALCRHTAGQSGIKRDDLLAADTLL